MAEFEGKSVVVTGGAKGIGRGVCEAFAVRGGAVLCLDVDDEAGEDLARRFERIVFRRADVSGMSPEEEARAWDAMARAHPLGRIGHPADQWHSFWHSRRRFFPRFHKPLIRHG